MSRLPSSLLENGGCTSGQGHVRVACTNHTASHVFSCQGHARVVCSNLTASDVLFLHIFASKTVTP